jgi:hypothetical protein
MSTESTPIAFNAFGKAPATSPKPPVLEYGTASAEMTATRIVSSYNGTPIVDVTVSISSNCSNFDMEDQGRIEKLLEEIRDLQRENLDEYKRVTQQSLEMQKRAGRAAGASCQDLSHRHDRRPRF